MEFSKNLKQGNTYIRYKQRIPKDLIIRESQFQELWNTHPEESGTIIVCGKEIKTPRFFQNYGESYNFSGVNHKSLAITPTLQKYLDYVNELNQDKPYNFNQILVNWYRDGTDYIGYHSDDEKQLIPNTSIYCFSFGSERDFLIKSKNTDVDELYKYKLLNNSLIEMGGECQKYYKHSISKITGEKSLKIKPRISITIRAFTPT